jgi:ribosome maturation factor RimP
MADNASVAAAVGPMLEPVAEACGVELYDLEYIKEGSNWILRLYIDKPAGVDLNDCEQVSRAAEAVLDARDPIPSAYVLEVSSPGIERRLKKEAHYARYTGKRVEVRLFKPIDGRKKFRGLLRGLLDGAVVIADEDDEERERAFGRALVSVCRLVYEEKELLH